MSLGPESLARVDVYATNSWRPYLINDCSCGGFIVTACKRLASIQGRLKYGLVYHCKGDSEHALQITQNMGNRTTNVVSSFTKTVILYLYD